MPRTTKSRTQRQRALSQTSLKAKKVYASCDDCWTCRSMKVILPLWWSKHGDLVKSSWEDKDLAKILSSNCPCCPSSFSEDLFVDICFVVECEECTKKHAQYHPFWCQGTCNNCGDVLRNPLHDIYCACDR